MSEEPFSLIKIVPEMTELQNRNKAMYQAHPKLYPYSLSWYVRLFDRPLLKEIKKACDRTPYFQQYSARERRACIRDMLLWDYVYGYAPGEYLENDFPSKSKEERLRYLSMLEMSQLIVSSTPKEAAERFFDQDKWVLCQMLKPTFHRDAVPVSPDGVTDGDALAFMRKHPVFLAKPEDGCGGHGIHRVETQPGREAETLAQLKKEGSLILEEILVQSKEMAQLNSSSVNTLRVVTFMGGGKFEISYIMLRIGRTNALVDNVSSGGLAIGVDLDTHKTFGKLCVDSRMLEDTRHPDSGVKLGDFELPDWDGLMATLTQGVSLLPKGVPYCGWDLAHTDHGWCVIECNDTASFSRSLFTGKGEAEYFRQKIKEYAALSR